MKRMSMMVAAALLCACGSSASEPGPRGVAQLEWLEGTWTNGDEDRWSEERWSDLKAEMMIGTGRSGAGQKLESFEFLRIVRLDNGEIAYLAAPGGGEPTEFLLTESSNGSAVFENADHDFPQRISYSLEGDALSVEISLIDGSNAIGWRLQRND